METNALGVFTKPTIFLRFVVLLTSLLVFGASHVDEIIHRKLAGSSIRTTGVISRCSAINAMQNKALLIQKKKDLSVAEMHANASFAVETARAITNK